MPLMKFVEFQKTIVDTLHTCLRITDKFFEILISHLDEKELNKKKEQLDLSKRPLLKSLLDFLENDCKISTCLVSPRLYDVLLGDFFPFFLAEITGLNLKNAKALKSDSFDLALEFGVFFSTFLHRLAFILA